jgi:hypothetical protein
MRYGLQVGGIAAPTVPAQMVDLHARWNRTDEQFVTHAMNEDVLPCSSTLTLPQVGDADAFEKTEIGVPTDEPFGQVSQIVRGQEVDQYPRRRVDEGALRWRGIELVRCDVVRAILGCGHGSLLSEYFWNTIAPFGCAIG